MKLTLVVCLFGSVAFADGDMTGGGKQCPPEGCTPPPCTVNCGGGNAMLSNDEDTSAISTDVVIETVDVVEQYLLLAL